MVFYAVSNGRNVGIFLNWNDCNNSVKGYKNALYKNLRQKKKLIFLFNQIIKLVIILHI